MSVDIDDLKKQAFKHGSDSEMDKHFKNSPGVYYAYYFTIHVAVRIVKFLLKTSVTPNQVSYLAIFIGVISAICFQFESNVFLLCGALLFEFYYVLDAVDGQLARVTGKKSLGGKFLDEWGNFIVPPLIVFSIGVRLVPSQIDIWLAFLAALSVIAIPIIELLTPTVGEQVSMAPAAHKVSSPSLARRVYSVLYRSITMPFVMNMVTLSTIFMLLHVRLWDIPFYTVFIYYFAIVGTVVWVLKGMNTARR